MGKAIIYRGNVIADGNGSLDIFISKDSTNGVQNKAIYNELYDTTTIIIPAHYERSSNTDLDLLTVVSSVTDTSSQVLLSTVASFIPDIIEGETVIFVDEVVKNGKKSKFLSVDDGFKCDTIPTADSSNLGKVIQYIGETTGDYIHGFFYECKDNGSGGYYWEVLYNQNCIGKRDILWNGTIANNGNFLLSKNPCDYDYVCFIVNINGENSYQTFRFEKEQLENSDKDKVLTFNVSSTSSCSFYAKHDEGSENVIVISSLTSCTIEKIVGYKLGIVSIENKIINPSIGCSYSDTEQITGGTYLGETIYRKTYKLSNFNNNDIIDTIPNLEYLIKADLTGVVNGIRYINYNVSTYRMNVGVVESNKNVVLNVENIDNSYPIYVTLEYTKRRS